MLKKRLYFPAIVLLLIVALAACNLPATPQPQAQAGPDAIFTAAKQTVDAQLTGAVQTQAAPPPAGSGPAVKIVSPAVGATVSGSTPVQVQFAASGGPFIEADLLVDNAPVNSLPLAADNQSPSGTLIWNTPTAGSHMLTVQVMTAEKMLYAATAQIVVQGQPAPVTTFTPTATVPPAVTPTSTQICNQAAFIMDVTVPDGTNFEPGATFTKTWRLKNTGVCSWTPSYTLAPVSGTDLMGGPASVALTGNFNPGDTMDISVNLTAPSATGDYTGKWKLRDAAGVGFTTVTVVIHVGAIGGAFRVIHVTYSQSGGCGAFHVVANIEVNGAGTVTYHWLRSDGGTDTAAHDPLVFGAAGTQSVSTGWSFSGAGTEWMKVYVDSPNHQAIGQVDLVCP